MGNARKALAVFGGIGVTLLIPTIFTVNVYLLAVLFPGLGDILVCFVHYYCQCVPPSNLFTSESVASVSGLSGTGAALGTIIVYLLAGRLSDARIATEAAVKVAGGNANGLQDPRASRACAR